MPPLLEPGSPEEIAVKPPSPFRPRPSALLSGLSVAAFCPAAQTCSSQHNCHTMQTIEDVTLNCHRLSLSNYRLHSHQQESKV